MLSAEESLLNLSVLPSDVIRNIIQLSVEFVDNMSLVSRLLFSEYLEYSKCNVSPSDDYVYSLCHFLITKSPILKCNGSEICKILQISPRWNSIAKNFLSDRRNLPKIKCIQWDVDKFMSPVLRMTMKTKYQQYFGVCEWPTKPGASETADVRNM